jgi:hypothetical protein
MHGDEFSRHEDDEDEEDAAEYDCMMTNSTCPFQIYLSASSSGSICLPFFPAITRHCATLHMSFTSFGS